MNFSDLINLYFARSGALQWYWTLYVVVLGGLLAFSSLRQSPDRLTCILVTVLYICFATKNLGAIRETTHERLAILSAIREYPADLTPLQHQRQLIVDTLNPPEYRGVRNFHVTCDVLTVAALWAMERRRCRLARAAARNP